jgi:hypothetical protein
LLLFTNEDSSNPPCDMFADPTTTGNTIATSISSSSISSCTTRADE